MKTNFLMLYSPNKLINTLSVLLLSLSCFIGFIIHDDYGIAWDELAQRRIGATTYNYVFNDSNRLLKYKQKDHGVAFELPLYILEKQLNITDTKTIFNFRHLATHLFYLIGVVFFYFLLKKHFNRRDLALLGAVFLLFSPRIYGHSFFNTKDLPFLVLFIISLYTLLLGFEKKAGIFFILHALACALLVNARIMGVLLVLFTLGYFFLDFIFERERRRKIALLATTYIASFIVFLVLFWPILWHAPIKNFIEIFASFSKFRWPGSVLYMGEVMSAKTIPWHYPLVWFVITTPIIYLSTFLVGFFFLSKSFIQHPISIFKNGYARNNTLFLCCFIAPLMAIIILQSVIYDGWRHLFFIYPSFLIIALLGIKHLYELLIKSRKAYRYFFIVVISLSLLNIGTFMLRNHPFQHVYFNLLVPQSKDYIKLHFDQDYWGTSYRKALEFLNTYDNSSTIKLKVANMPGKHNLIFLDPKSKNRFELVKKVTDADYFITNYRRKPINYTYEEIYSIEVNNSSILSVFKLDK